MRSWPVAVLFALLPAPVMAQALQCNAPANPPVPRFDGPTASQPKRLMPIGRYTLALSWSPQYCRESGGRPASAFQCGGRDGRFGFTLHGLWPDGEGRDWPQYCRPARILPPDLIRRNLCVTPSAQLLQHEWAKHGTCMAKRPEDYFRLASRLYSQLRYPDMTALSRRPGLTAGQFAQAFAAVNPGWRADMVRVGASDGWLDELWLCLDRKLRPAQCPAHQGGVGASARLRIWRGGR